MSKHNDIYNILGKLASLEPKQESVPAKEKVYESVDPRGSVTEGVRAVEQQLSEKYMGFKAVEKSAKKGGAENPAAVAAAIGRKKYGKAAFQKAAAAGKKMGEAEELVTPEKREQYRNLAKQLKKSGADATTAFQKGGEELGIFKKDLRSTKEDAAENIPNEESLEEKWGGDYSTPEARKGMFKGKTEADLKKQLSNLKKTGPHEKGSKEYTKMKQLQFAIRAKSGWGKVAESVMDVVRQTYDDSVTEWPLGTPIEDIIQSWADDIRERTGKNVSTKTLEKLYHEYAKQDYEKLTGKRSRGMAENLNEVTQGVEHSEWVDNVKDHYHPTPVKIIKKRTDDGRHIASHAMVSGKKVGQYNMNTGVGTFTTRKKQGVAEEQVDEVSAPGQEAWIKKNKQHFIDQYGKKKGLEVLYATAWKRSKKDEDIGSFGNTSGGTGSGPGVPGSAAGVIGEDPMSAYDDSAAYTWESQERPYICVHAKKGKCEVTANSSYEAAKKAAEKWKLKNTAGIDAHLADVAHDASELDEGETTYTKTGRIHKGTYGTEYQGDSDDEESVDSRGRGRPRIHAKKAEPAEKKGRGRPKKADTGEKHSSEHMPWGSYEKSGMKKGAHHKLPHWAKGRTTTHKIDESINLKKMMEEQHMTIDEMLECLDTDMRMFKETGHMSPLLRDCMDMFSANRKQIADEAATDVMHPDAPAYLRKQKGTPLSLKDLEQHQTSQPSHPDFEFPADARDFRDVSVNKVQTPFDEELNELARLAGLSVDEQNAGPGTGGMEEGIADEGNEFSGALAKARAQGKKEFDVDGKEYPVKEALAKDEDTYGDPEFDDESEEVVNKPKEQYYSMRASSLNPGEGDSGEKTMNPDRPTKNNGDNAMSRPPVRESENRFKGRLAREYESIKKVQK